MYAVHKRFGGTVLGYTSYGLGYRAVGQQHEFFDEFVGFFRFFGVYTDGTAFFVDDEFHFLTVEVDGSVCETLLAQSHSQAIECEDFVCTVSFPAFDYLLGFFISKTAVGAYDGAGDMRFQYFPVIIEFKNDRETELFFVRSQGTDLIAKSLGKHGNRPVDQIDRCTALVGFPVDRTSRLDIMCYVGYMHADFPFPVGQSAQGKGVVEVFGIGRVDGKCRYVAKIFTAGDFVSGYAVVDFIGELFEFFGIVSGQSELCEYGVHLGIVFSAFPEYFNDCARRTGIVRRPVGKSGDDFFSFFGSEGLVGRDIYTEVECPAVDAKGCFFCAGFFDCSDNLLGRASFGDVGYFGLSPVFSPGNEQILDFVAR